MTRIYKIFQQDMSIKSLLEVAGVDTTQGKAKELVEAAEINEAKQGEKQESASNDKKCSCGHDPKNCKCKAGCKCGCKKKKPGWDLYIEY